MVTTKKLHFRINYEWLTEHIRNLWSEGRYSLALDTLESTNLPIEIQYNVIRGKTKLINDPSDPSEIAGMTADDDWKIDISTCHHMRYPDPLDLPKLAENALIDQDKYKRELENQAYDLYEKIDACYNGERLSELMAEWYKFPYDIRNQFDTMSPTFTPERGTRFELAKQAMNKALANGLSKDDALKVFHDVVTEGEPTTDLPDESLIKLSDKFKIAHELFPDEINVITGDEIRDPQKFVQKMNKAIASGDENTLHELYRLQEMSQLLPNGAPLTHDEFMENTLAITKRETPKPTTDYTSEWGGWVLPDGKFYEALNYMEHISLCGAIADKSEEECEKLGWIKITKDTPNKPLIQAGNRTKPTQKQIDTLWDWTSNDEKRISAYKDFMIDYED